MRTDDHVLVRRAQAGHVDAFEELVVRYRDAVYRVALRLLGTPADAEDAAQDALVTAWQALPTFRGDSAVSSWLFRIVVNKCYDVQRRSRFVQPVDLQDAGAQAQFPAVVDTGTTVEQQHRVDAVRRALAALPLDLRAPLVLRELEGCSYAEVAEVLGLPEATVRGRLARGRQELVRHVQEWS